MGNAAAMSGSTVGYAAGCRSVCPITQPDTQVCLILVTRQGQREQSEALVGECVKCGYRNATGSAACAQCSWPFSRHAWGASKLRIRRIRLDTGCVNAK